MSNDRTLAWVGFILLLLALVVPMWTVELGSQTDQEVGERALAYPWHPLSEYTSSWLPYATLGIMILGGAWAGLRLVAVSEKYEPAAWARDLPRIALVLAGAALSVMAWPANFADGSDLNFWGRVVFAFEDAPQHEFYLATSPGWGWWLLWLSAFSFLFARRAIPEERA